MEVHLLEIIDDHEAFKVDTLHIYVYGSATEPL